jgi:hypothetical protein
MAKIVADIIRLSKRLRRIDLLVKLLMEIAETNDHELFVEAKNLSEQIHALSKRLYTGTVEVSEYDQGLSPHGAYFDVIASEVGHAATTATSLIRGHWEMLTDIKKLERLLAE